MLQDIAHIRETCNGRGVVASDRRYRQALDALKARAFLHGRSHVDDDDLTLLEHMLWSDPADRDAVRQAIHKVLRGHEEEARNLLFQARELLAYAQRAWPEEEQAVRAAVEAHTKIKKIASRLDALTEQSRARGTPSDTVAAVREELLDIQRDVERVATKQGLQ